MGDMAKDFKALNEHNKDRRQKNFEKAKEIFLQPNPPITFVWHTAYHWGTQLNGLKLDYWPSSSLWRYKGKPYRGNPKNLISFIKNRTKDETQKAVLNLLLITVLKKDD